jgi:hypothetical protein
MQEKETKSKYRVVASLKREALDFLDELEKDLYFIHGIHIPRAKLIEEIIETFREKGTMQGIEEELIKNFKQGKEKRFS